MDETKQNLSVVMAIEKLKSAAPSVIIVAAAFLAYLFWALSLPTWQAPDEYMRFDIPLFILQYSELPNGFDEAVRNQIWGTSYAFSPYGSSLFAALFMLITSLFTTDTNALLLSARLVSVLSGSGTVAICLMIGKVVFKTVPEVRYLFAILVGFLPQFVFLSAYFNCDAFAVFSTSLIFYSWVRGLFKVWDKLTCCILGVGLGLCLLSYFNAYAFIPVSAVLFFCSQISLRKSIRKPPDFIHTIILNTILVIAIVLALSAWFFIRNAILYEGDLLGLNASSISSELFAQEGFKPSERSSLAEQGVTYFGLLTDNGFAWTISSIKSFIGLFGYMSIAMPKPLYGSYIVVFFVILVFATFAAVKMLRSRKSEVLLALACMSCIIIPVFLSMYYSLYFDYQAQGRYFISALIPLMFLSSFGLYRAIEKLRNKSVQRVALISFSGVYLSFMLLVLITTILPECVQPFSTIAGQ